MNHENLWAPWRMAYVRELGRRMEQLGETRPPENFLAAYWAAPERDDENLVLERDEHGMILLNRYPYANGHLLVALGEALEAFYKVRDVRGLKKKPSTSELLDWIKLLLAEDIPPEALRSSDSKKAIPPLYGALLKNEQDVHLFEQLVFLDRRTNPQ